MGNSRWHCAEACGFPNPRIRHLRPEEGLAWLGAAAPLGWAAVGAMPPGDALDPRFRLQTPDVPLRDVPPWLGVDRALAGWMAWRLQGSAVLVADGGTVLSLTHIDAAGGFRGGRLMGGLSLQLTAMAEGTAALPEPPAPSALEALLAGGAWPRDTRSAMVVGVAHGLADALASALLELRRTDPGCVLVLTGGDGETLLPLVRVALGAGPTASEGPAPVTLEADLALRGLMALRPRAMPDQVSPRSAST